MQQAHARRREAAPPARHRAQLRGCARPRRQLNASFAPLTPRAGDVAFVTQSGALLTAVLDWADSRGIGFSHMVSLGGMADVDFGDMLDYLANDEVTHAILLYVEAITHARKFMSAARAAARSKPVIVCKAGRHAEGARAARSHSGALAGSDAVYDAAFRRAGMLRVFALEELFDAVEMLALGRRPLGDRLAIVTNGGGMGILATDRLIDEHGSSRARRASLRAFERRAAARLVARQSGRSDRRRRRGALSRGARNRDRRSERRCNAGAELSGGGRIEHRLRAGSRRRTCAAPAQTVARELGGRRPPARRRSAVDAHGVPTYATPEDAVRAFMYLVNYQRNQAALLETPPRAGRESPDRATVRAFSRRRVAARRRMARRGGGARADRRIRNSDRPLDRLRDAERRGDGSARLGVPVALKIYFARHHAQDRRRRRDSRSGRRRRGARRGGCDAVARARGAPGRARSRLHGRADGCQPAAPSS